MAQHELLNHNCYFTENVYIYFISYDKDEQRLMEVSTDSGATWNEVQLPAIAPDRVSIMLLRRCI